MLLVLAKYKKRSSKIQMIARMIRSPFDCAFQYRQGRDDELPAPMSLSFFFVFRCRSESG
jgi:hypothetical protein